MNCNKHKKHKPLRKPRLQRSTRRKLGKKTSWAAAVVVVATMITLVAVPQVPHESCEKIPMPVWMTVMVRMISVMTITARILIDKIIANKLLLLLNTI